MLRPNLVFGLLVVVGYISHVAAEEAVDLPWMLSAPKRTTPPKLERLPNGARVVNAIDAFVQQELADKSLVSAPQANKYTLIRRAYFDLIGLPPAPDRIRAFVADKSPTAWEDLIEELLKSPQYGERWARHWLDVARYADSQGFEGDNSIPNAWRYRDYVIRSFNQDKPYNVFVQEQIAADEIWPDNLDLDPKRVYILSESKRKHLEARIGTGFYALNPQVAESALDAERLQHETLTDWVDTTCSVFLGLTVACARCHDHKFDPVSQQDYYGMQAIFARSEKQYLHLHTPMMRGDWHWLYPRLTAVEEAKQALKAFRGRVGTRKLTPAEDEEKKRLRDAVVDRLMELPEKANSVPNEPFDILMTSPTATVLGHVHPKLHKPVHFLNRGELEQRKQLVEAAIPSKLAQATGHAGQIVKGFESRKELALWLTRPDHPLTARVMVNRIWQWHFGRGIVATPNDFGAMGAAATHPELLDWLATEFVRQGWSIKQMHRLIMKSATYQAASTFSSEIHLKTDPKNKYLWRMNRRRLEAEALWDTVHQTAGTLNPKMYGRPVVPPLAEDELAALREKWQWPVSGDPREHTRRGLYIMVRRNFRFPMFEVFDAPLTEVSCPQRDVTTVAPQALWTLNSGSVYRQARHLAELVLKTAQDNPEKWIEEVWFRMLGRPATGQEMAETLKLLSVLEQQGVKNPKQGATALPPHLAKIPAARAAAYIHTCLALFNHNEFSFVD